MRLQPTILGSAVPILNSPESRVRRLPAPATCTVRYSSLYHIHCRRYASIAGDQSAADLSWPTKSSFTPYDIFRQEQTAPYSKRRYYELVKLYHPDNQHNDHPILKNVSNEVRLRRYRLIVTAHEILSDPVKRAAYDRDGSGWHSHPDHPNPRAYTYTYSKPADYDASVFHNGTWEDWERYYNRHQPKQVQVVSHRTFITFVVLIVAFGGFAQASWISQHQNSLDRRIQEVNIKSARLLAGRREQTDSLQSVDKSVRKFLIQRDPTRLGLKEEEGAVYKETFGPETPRLETPQSHLDAAENADSHPGKPT